MRPCAELSERISVVVLTHNRPDELDRCLRHLRALPEQVPLIVVDNASQDDAARRFGPEFPRVQWVRSGHNAGAAGRNLGVAAVRTPYVAFCDDDTWWAPGALTLAARCLDEHPGVGALSAEVRVGPQRRLDPTCEAMAASPLPRHGLPGPALIGFMAGAAVVRTAAYRAVGGYEPRFFLGGEEALIGLDLLEAGWKIVYAGGVITHHHPSPRQRNTRGRHIALGRNRLWLGWLRLPWRTAWVDARHTLLQAARHHVLTPVLLQALAGLPWALARRQVVSPEVHAAYCAVHLPGREPPPRPPQRGR